MSFFTRLENRCRAVDSLLCVGLDPHAAELDAATPEAARAFCLRLIEATHDVAAAYKPNAAFFEALGPDGVAALREVIAAVPDDIPVVLDAKRGDISSTAAAYATAAFEVLGADAITLHGYMGRDSVAPFVGDPERGAFVLCRTSNPGGADLQDLALATGERVYERVADLVDRWNAHDNVGLVVGATRPDELAAVRRRSPRTWILAPGVGAQGASLADAMAAGLRDDGLGLLIPVSRGISKADDPRAAAVALVEAMRAARDAHTPPPALDTVAAGLLRAGCVKLGSFTLKSGLTSPIYLDLRRLVGDPALLAEVARAYARVLGGLSYDVLAPLPYAGLPIGTAVSLATGVPLVYPRREVKAYGTKAAVEGVFTEGQVAVVLDDLATTGSSVVDNLPKLTDAGLVVRDCVVLIDRGSGGAETMARLGVTLHAVFHLADLLDAWERAGAIAAAQAAEVRAFLAATAPGPGAP
ncbi:MAG: orotidine-5'-phosphate decarboxylase [Alphaproteobacteria bacterium]|nr:orotidine-5'-phosphate decarboxylase [Alphaproteobacteria bacterium]